MTEPDTELDDVVEPLAPLDELIRRLEEDLRPGEDEDDKREFILAALEDASDEVRHYGVSAWTQETAPRIAKKITLTAAKRYLDNTMGLDTSRAGDETLVWQRRDWSGEVALTRREQEILGRFQARSRLSSVPVTVWNPEPRQHDPRVNVVRVGTPTSTPFPWATRGEWPY